MKTEMHVSLAIRDDAKSTHNWRNINGQSIVSLHIESGDGVSVSIVGDSEDFKRLFEPFRWTWADNNT